MIGKQGQKANGIEYVRFTDAIRTCNTGKWPEIYVKPNQVFESIHL